MSTTEFMLWYIGISFFMGLIVAASIAINSDRDEAIAYGIMTAIFWPLFVVAAFALLPLFLLEFFILMVQGLLKLFGRKD